jgi:hypothetical protein
MWSGCGPPSSPGGRHFADVRLHTGRLLRDDAPAPCAGFGVVVVGTASSRSSPATRAARAAGMWALLALAGSSRPTVSSVRRHRHRHLGVDHKAAPAPRGVRLRCCRGASRRRADRPIRHCCRAPLAAPSRQRAWHLRGESVAVHPTTWRAVRRSAARALLRDPASAPRSVSSASARPRDRTSCTRRSTSGATVPRGQRALPRAPAEQPPRRVVGRSLLSAPYPTGRSSGPARSPGPATRTSAPPPPTSAIHHLDVAAPKSADALPERRSNAVAPRGCGPIGDLLASGAGQSRSCSGACSRCATRSRAFHPHGRGVAVRRRGGSPPARGDPGRPGRLPPALPESQSWVASASAPRSSARGGLPPLTGHRQRPAEPIPPGGEPI